MLSWWLGKPADEGHHDENSEPPETPAPVFAARALKSALFGTPAPPEEEYESEEEEALAMAAKDTKPQYRSASPTKPSGILLTPGTATVRRKTVSFGNEVVEKEATRIGKSGLPDDCPGKFPSPWTTTRETSAKPRRKTTLTRTLENVKLEITKEQPKEVQATKAESNNALHLSSEDRPLLSHTAEIASRASVASKSKSRRPSKSHKTSQNLPQNHNEQPHTDFDMTIDLNDPHSQSGKYWKSQYQTYHEDALKEMEKLLKYKQLAKSYAKKRDKEAIDLNEKLMEEQRKVIEMEDKLSSLSTRIAAAGRDGNEDDSPELVRELARQTALAVQYKTQVEEFKNLLDGGVGGGLTVHSNDGSRTTASRDGPTLLDKHRETKKERDQSKEMAQLHEEMQKLHHDLSIEKEKTTQLEGENAKLTQDLLHADLRFERHVEMCEKERITLEGEKEKRNDDLKKLSTAYEKFRESARSQRRETFERFNKGHDQLVVLRKEIASLRGTESTAKELQRVLQRTVSEHERVVNKLQKQIEALQECQNSGGTALKGSRDRILPDPPSTALPSNGISQTRDSFIPLSISRPSKSVASSKQTLEMPTKFPGPRSSHSALSEIINNATADMVPPLRHGPVQRTPMAKMTTSKDRYSNITVASPGLQLPSPETPLPPINNRVVHERNCHISPRPSMFNIASSPPKVAMVRAQASDQLGGVNNENIPGHRYEKLAYSHLSSLEGSKSKARRDVPPERAAAAKARLEQKIAEKRRAAASGD